MTEKPKADNLTFSEKIIDYAWRAIPLAGFQHLEVSTNGEIRVLLTAEPLDTDNEGYIEGEETRMQLGKLVLLTWEGQPEVVYLDGNTENHHYLNLAWMSPETARHMGSRYLSTVPNRALNAKQVQTILRSKTKRTARDLSIQYHVSRWTVYAIWQGRVWKDEYRRWQREVKDGLR